jgi:hypothetical protein
MNGDVRQWAILAWVFLGHVYGLSCSCGTLVASDSTTNTQCFTAGSDIDSFCSKTRVRLDNTAALPALCIGAQVGSLRRECSQWFLSANADGTTYNVHLCADGVSITSCTEVQTTGHGRKFDIRPIQTQSAVFFPLWASDSQCLVSLCPDAAVDDPTLPDPYLTLRNGTYFSVCNRVVDTGNICNGGFCSCKVFQDGTTAYTGNACQFEKGQGQCCFPTQPDQIPRTCCLAATPGQCQTNPDFRMCGILGQSRSPFCQSPDGIAPPTCEKQILSDGELVFAPNCPEGLTCPGDPNLPFPSKCREPDGSPKFGWGNQTCACQCSLCAPPCDQLGSFGVCTTTPTPGCSCVVPGTPCVDSPGVLPCDDDIPCSQTDLCGGPTCNERVNQCRTLDDCDTAELWRFNVAHSCVCYGHGLCNLDKRECECFDTQGTLSGPPVNSVATRCAALDSCAHCNTNPSLVNLTRTSPSRCTPFPGFPAAFNCTCRDYWYTSGSFQNTGTSRSTPVYQCSTGTCVGYFSLRNISTATLDGFFANESLAINLTSGRCICPPGLIHYIDPVSGRKMCRVMGPVDPDTGVECGHAAIDGGFIQLILAPSVLFFTATSNEITYTNASFPRATLASLGGPARCNCDGFFNATYPDRGQWYAPNGTFCRLWCPPQVTFVIDTMNMATTRRCENCAEFGFTTIDVGGGNTQCGNTLCLNGGQWNQTAQRCDCLQLPYIYNFPLNINCSLDWCFNVGVWNPMTMQCTCPPAFYPNPYPPAIGPANATGCLSRCYPGRGVPNPTNGYQNCSCFSTFFSGPTCSQLFCAHGQLKPDQSGCICPAIWTGDACDISLCVNGHPNPDDDTQCVCDDGWAGDFEPPDTFCNVTQCTAFEKDGPIFVLFPNTTVFLYEDNNPLEEELSLLPGVPDPGSPSDTCVCMNDKIDKQLVGVLLACNKRLCKADQDIIAKESAPEFGFCRCTCPSLLLVNGPNIMNPTDLAGCPNVTNFVNFLPDSLDNPCLGFEPTSDHLDWVPQCLGPFTGVDCMSPRCTGHFAYDPTTQACTCANSWVPRPGPCNVCPLTGAPGRINFTTCSCIDVVLVGTTCTNSTCDPTNVACNTPNAMPPVNPPLDTSTPAPTWPWILLLTLVCAGAAAGIGVGIYFGVEYCRKQTEEDTAKRAAEQQQMEQGLMLSPAAATTLENTPLIVATTPEAEAAAAAAAVQQQQAAAAATAGPEAVPTEGIPMDSLGATLSTASQRKRKGAPTPSSRLSIAMKIGTKNSVF